MHTKILPKTPLQTVVLTIIFKWCSTNERTLFRALLSRYDLQNHLSPSRHGLCVSILGVAIGCPQPATAPSRATPRDLTRIAADITMLLALAAIVQHPHYHGYHALSRALKITPHNVGPSLVLEGEFTVRPPAPRVRPSG